MVEDHKGGVEMKYYDGMGKDVTDYVNSLEQKIAELEAKYAPKMEETTVYSQENVGIVEEEKPNPKKRKVTKIANTQ